jgi:ATP/maltotriose-dependent transcriptional regulator MalT
MIAMSFHGPTPVEDVLRQIEALEEQDPGHSILKVNLLRLRGELEAMQGAFDTGRALVGEARAVATELGLKIMLATGVAHSAGDVELLAGDPARAEQELRQGCETLEDIGDWGHLVTLIPYLADALLAQGRGQEAGPAIHRAFENVNADDADPQIALRRVRARLLAEQGDLEEAERVGRESVTRAEATDFLTVRGLALSDLAEVLMLAGKPTEAADVFDQAAGVYDRKGNLVMASRTRARLVEVRAPG